MKYQPPYGSSDPNASYVNGNPSTGIEGSIPPAAMMEEPQREIINALLAANLTPSDGTLTQLAAAMSIGLFVGVFGGSANALTATIPGNVTFDALQVGMVVHGIVGPNANTSAATLAITGFVSGTGAKPIVRTDGATALVQGDLGAGVLVSFRWDGSNWRSIGRVGSEIVLPAPSGATLYVRTDGNDSNDGSANTAAKAFQTIAAAIGYGSQKFYLAGKTLTIQLGIPGTYVPPGVINIGAVQVSIVGDTANQGSYILSGSGPAGGSQGLITASGCRVAPTGLTINNTGTINGHILGINGGAVIPSYVTFTGTGTSAYGIMWAASLGAITIGPGCIVSASGYALFWATGTSTISLNANLQVTGTPTYTVATCYATLMSSFTAAPGVSISGSANGARYLATNIGAIATNGGGPNFFPGSSAGSVNASTGGVYT